MHTRNVTSTAPQPFPYKISIIEFANSVYLCIQYFEISNYAYNKRQSYPGGIGSNLVTILDLTRLLI